MRILITGANGQLGKSIQKHAKSFPKYSITSTDFKELDITDFEQLKKYLSTHQFDVIINCAAYTAVDKAEKEKDKAELLNVTATEYLACISKEFNIYLIHISTDFIFNGRKNSYYSEDDKPDPLSIYGMTKAKGEKAILKYGKNASIIRTSWLYSEFGHNFMKTIIHLANERDSLDIVNDQTGTPTYAGDLAKCILNILSAIQKIKGVEIFNYSNEGETSWYGFAKAIVKIKKINCKINPIPTKDYPLPAKRPTYSVLNKEKIKSKFDIAIPQWEKSLEKCLSKVKQDNDLI